MANIRGSALFFTLKLPASFHISSVAAQRGCFSASVSGLTGSGGGSKDDSSE